MPLNNFNKTLNKVNRTATTVNRTQNTVRNVNNQIQRQQNQRMREQTWKCACGQSNQSRFCGSCGKPPTVCPNCNIIVSTQFCPDCGASAIAEQAP